MRFRLNMKYLCAFIIVFIIEVLIAVFVNDKFIRPYVGDMLVVVLIYCFIRSFVGIEGKLLPLYIFVFAALTEVDRLCLKREGNSKVVVKLSQDEPEDLYVAKLICNDSV